MPQFVLGGAWQVMFGILLTSIAAVVLNLYFNGARGDSTAESVEASKSFSGAH